MKLRIPKGLYGKQHFSDCTAAQMIVTPLYAFLETTVAGMDDITSLKSRGIAILSTYAVLGNLTKFRDWSKKRLGITKKSSEKIKFLYDTGFVASMLFGIKPLTYLAAGETDWKKIAIATFSSTVMGGVLGGPIFYGADIFRDLIGVQESERIPKFLCDKSKRFKKNLAIILLASSLTATGLVYTLTPNKQEGSINKSDYIQEMNQPEMINNYKPI